MLSNYTKEVNIFVKLYKGDECFSFKLYRRDEYCFQIIQRRWVLFSNYTKEINIVFKLYTGDGYLLFQIIRRPEEYYIKFSRSRLLNCIQQQISVREIGGKPIWNWSFDIGTFYMPVTHQFTMSTFWFQESTVWYHSQHKLLYMSPYPEISKPILSNPIHPPIAYAATSSIIPFGWLPLNSG